MSQDDRWKNLAYHRVDKITDIEIIDEPLIDIRTIKGYENGINYKELSTQMPYFNSTKRPETIVFYCEEEIVGQIVDWFGDEVLFNEEDNKIKVTIKANPVSITYWLLQYIQYIEIIEPTYLKDKIVSILKEALDKYK